MSNEVKGARFALWVVVGITAMTVYVRQILAAVTEPIRKEWALSDTMMGTLGTAFILIYAAVGVPLGRLADSWSRKKILSLGVTVLAHRRAVETPDRLLLALPALFYAFHLVVAFRFAPPAKLVTILLVTGFAAAVNVFVHRERHPG